MNHKVYSVACCAVVLWVALPVLAQAPRNGSFERPALESWAVEGDVQDGSGFAYFGENDQGALSRIYQNFVLPIEPQTLSFQFLISSFPTAAAADEPVFPAEPYFGPVYRGWDQRQASAASGFPYDSFSVFLLDANTLERLLPPCCGEPPCCEPPLFSDEFFFIDNQETIIKNDAYVTAVEDPDVEGLFTVTLDAMSALTGCTAVRLEFGLLGGPDGYSTFVALDEIRVSSTHLSPDVQISEVRLDQPGDFGENDPDEYIEISGEPCALTNALSYVVIGDSPEGGSGVVEAIIPLDQTGTDVDGRLLISEETLSLATAHLAVDDLNLEDDDHVTHLLVNSLNDEVALGDDLDIGDDGELDDPSLLGQIIDQFALVGPPNPDPPADLVYSCVGVGPFGTGLPQHIYRCHPSGAWEVNSDPVTFDQDTPSEQNTDCSNILCPQDLNNTNTVDAADLAFLLGSWGPCPVDPCDAPIPGLLCPADFNDDDVVDAADLAILLGSWGVCD